MKDVSHDICRLPQTGTSGLHKLPPNASFCRRLWRKFKKLTILDPENVKCKVFFQNKSAMLAEQRRHIKGPYSYMIHPFSKFNAFLETTFLVVWLVKMIANPMDGNMVTPSFFFKVFDVAVLTTLQVFLIVTFFFVGYLDEDTDKVVLKHSSVVRRYLKTFFVADFVSLHISSTMSDSDSQWRLLRLVRYIDVPCCYMRLYSVLRYVDHTGEALRISFRVRKCVTYLLKTYLCLHFFCCVIYFVPQVVYATGNWPSDSWLVQAKIQPTDQPPVYKIYSECFLLATCFFFGASAGKYPITETNEQICLSLILIFGRLYTLFLLADVLRFFGIVGLSEVKYEKQMLQLSEYMMATNMPPTLRGRIRRYYEAKLQKRYFNEKEILGSLSPTLKAELFLFYARPMMNKFDLFKDLPHNEIATLISLMRLETFAPGDVIYKPQDISNNIYFISSGTVAMLTSGGEELCHMEDGDVMGLCTSVLQKRRYTAKAIETTELFVISLRELQGFLAPYPMAAYYLGSYATERYATFRQMERDTKSKLDNCVHELRKGMLLERRRRREIIQE